jgi:DnaJ-class molecular chaperone
MSFDLTNEERECYRVALNASVALLNGYCEDCNGTGIREGASIEWPKWKTMCLVCGGKGR